MSEDKLREMTVEEAVEALKEYKEKTGLSQSKIAKKMGVSSPYVGEILRGTRSSANAQRKVCEAVGLDYDELMKRLEEGA